MKNTIADKLKVKPDHTALVMNPPPGYAKILGRSDTKAVARRKYDAVLLFVASRAEADRFGPIAIKALRDEDGLLWLAYPKKASAVITDLSRDRGWDALIAEGYEVTSLVAIDSIWSALRFRPKGAAAKAKTGMKTPAAATKTSAASTGNGVKSFTAVLERPDGDMDATFVSVPFDVKNVYGTGGHVKVKATFDGHPYRGILANMGTGCHIIIVTQAVRKAIGKRAGEKVAVTLQRDTEERIVDMPTDLTDALGRNPKAKKFYDGLSYTNRKEYAGWISSAKKAETREKRLADTIAKLLNGKKNPSEK